MPRVASTSFSPSGMPPTPVTPSRSTNRRPASSASSCARSGVILRNAFTRSSTASIRSRQASRISTGFSSPAARSPDSSDAVRSASEVLLIHSPFGASQPTAYGSPLRPGGMQQPDPFASLRGLLPPWTPSLHLHDSRDLEPVRLELVRAGTRLLQRQARPLVGVADHVRTWD